MLVLREGETPDDCAQAFLTAHDLPETLLEPLRERIFTCLLEGTRLPLSAPAERPLTAHEQLRAPRRRIDAVASGERMHREALTAKARRELKAAREKDSREDAELLALRQPAITALARRLPRAEPAWQRLSGEVCRVQLERRAAAAQLVAQRSERELDECTFTPAVTVASGRLMQARQSAMREAGLTSHETLFADAQRREQRLRERQSRAPEGATFAPRVLHPSVGGSVAHAAARLQQAGLEARARAAQERSRAAQVDLTTGRRLFEPETGRAPLSGRNGASVSEHLYSLRLNPALSRFRIADEQRRELQKEAAAASAKSIGLAAARRRRRFGDVFRALDLRGCGVINLWDAATDALQRLTPDIAADVQRCASTAEEEVADEAAFCELMERSVSETQTGPRPYLAASIRLKEGSGPEQAFTFQPAIDEHSRRLAERLREPSVRVEDALQSAEAEYALHRKALAAAADAALLADCSFAPQRVAASRPSTAWARPFSPTPGNPFAAVSLHVPLRPALDF